MTKVVESLQRSKGSAAAGLRPLVFPIANVDESPCDCGRGGHGGGDQVGAAPLSLSPFEVPVAGRSAALARLERVGVHAQAHAATRLAPFKACLREDLV